MRARRSAIAAERGPDDVDATVAYVAPIDYPEDAVQSPTNRYIAFLTGVEGEVLTLFVASLKPGHYDCSSSGFAIGFSFTGEDPLAEKTAWSDVGDGYCSFDISKGPGGDDLEARFSGLITANDHMATYLIDDGYFFSRKPQRGVTRTPSPPPKTQPSPPTTTV